MESQLLTFKGDGFYTPEGGLFSPARLDPLALRKSRAVGIHASDLITIAESVIGKQYKDDGRGTWDMADDSGWALEDALGLGLRAQLLDGRKVIPWPSQVCDGIVCSPDGVEFTETGGLEDWEYKFTWKSLDTSPPHDVFRYRVQFMAYCYYLTVMTEQLVNVTNCLALYCCGYYKPFARPILVWDRITFTEREILDNWKMLQGCLEIARERGGMER